mmetsp:Transcript_7070/g.31120  ORF Transcript_7070/g.31120 Transcript_7070/m.31120 type:complete len:206 (-) Transcript_7070:4295-4912(-)
MVSLLIIRFAARVDSARSLRVSATFSRHCANQDRFRDRSILIRNLEVATLRLRADRTRYLQWVKPHVLPRWAKLDNILVPASLRWRKSPMPISHDLNASRITRKDCSLNLAAAVFTAALVVSLRFLHALNTRLRVLLRIILQPDSKLWSLTAVCDAQEVNALETPFRVILTRVLSMTSFSTTTPSTNLIHELKLRLSCLEPMAAM